MKNLSVKEILEMKEKDIEKVKFSEQEMLMLERMNIDRYELLKRIKQELINRNLNENTICVPLNYFIEEFYEEWVKFYIYKDIRSNKKCTK